MVHNGHNIFSALRMHAGAPWVCLELSPWQSRRLYSPRESHGERRERRERSEAHLYTGDPQVSAAV